MKKIQNKKIAILGLGLMGASLALALKKRGFTGTILGYARREETRSEAMKRKMVDAVFSTPEEAVQDADLIVVCLPIWAISDLAKQIIPALKAGAIVTDVGSTKSELLLQLEPLFGAKETTFIGSHPIAGSEKTGIDAGDSTLYEGRLTVICPTKKTLTEAQEMVCDLWESVGAEVVEMSPNAHDAMLASTSHLPHMVAAALARSVAGKSPKEKANFCGTGFKDTTRVASGSANMWVDIIDTNRSALEAELNTFHEELQGLINILRQGNSDDIRTWLEEAAEQRNLILQHNKFLKR